MLFAMWTHEIMQKQSPTTTQEMFPSVTECLAERIHFYILA